MTAIWAYILAHWGVIAAIATPVALATISAVISQYRDPDHNPATPPPIWLVPFIVARDLLTTRAAAGTVGIAGSKWSVPFLHYPRKKIKGLPLPPPDKTAAALLPIIFMCFVVSGCKATPSVKATPGVKAWGVCEVTKLSQELKAAVPCVKAALSSPSFESLLSGCGALALDQLGCLVVAVTAAAESRNGQTNIASTNPVDIEIVNNGHAWQKIHLK